MRKAVAAFVAVAAVAALVAAGAAPAGAQDTRQQQQQVARQRAQLQVQINLAVASAAAVQAEATRLDRMVAAEQRAVAQARAGVAAALSAVNDAERRLAGIDAAAAAARDQLVARAVNLYEHPFQSTVLVLTNVGTLNDYADRQELVTVVEGNTSAALDAYRQQHLDEAAAHRQLLAAKTAAERNQAALHAREQELLSAEQSAHRTHASLAARIKAMQAESAVLAAQEGKLEAILAAQEIALRNSATVAVPTGPPGRLIWPIHGVVTQEFGAHAGGFHPGIDIAAAYGTPIHASGTGVVIFAGWESGYGNYTCINHGGGISTCYGHQSAIFVTVGQSVTQGQVIGDEGSTGDSTGPHVHFEVRVNTVPSNPRAFIPGNP